MPVFATSVIFGVFAMPVFSTGIYRLDNTRPNPAHRVQRRMISVDNFFVFLRLLFLALLLLYVT